MSTNLIPVKQLEIGQHLNLLIIYNALDMSDREAAKLNYDRNKTLADYMVGLPDPSLWSVSVNAEPYAPEEWADIYPQPNDFIVVIPIPYGGGGSKNVLRMVAMIAVAVAAPYAAGMMFATGTAAFSAATAAFTMAGGLLVNALLPPPKPSSNNIGDTSESPTYGLDGAKNTQTEDTIIPLIYGEYRYAGNYVNVRTENRGRDQLVYAQAVISEGEIESITDFEIEDQPIENYEDVSTVIRRGTDNQTIVGWFASSMAMKNKSVTLDTGWTTHTTVGEVDGFRIDLVWPNGLSVINDKGKRENRSVSFEIQYRKVDTTTWSNLFVNQFRELTTTAIPQHADHLKAEYRQSFTGTGQRNVTGRLYVRNVGKSWQLMQTVKASVALHTGKGFLSGSFSVGLGAEFYSDSMEYKIDWEGANPTILASARYPLSPKVTDKTAQPLRKSYQSGLLPEGVYEIRIRRTNTESTADNILDRVTLTDVGEIISERVRYNFTAFYGVKVRLSDQLSGLPKITAKIKGIKVPHYDWSGKLVKRAWSANPAWITLDMLTNARYGAGKSVSSIDIRMFVDWAEFCDKNKFYFNGVIDTMTNIWDACQLVLRVGHARFVTIGNMTSVSIYRKSDPVMMFGSGNILEGSLKLEWQSLEDRANEFEIEFYDRENRNKQNTVRVVNEAAIARGEMQRISTTRMVGIDNQRQALFEAHFQKALNEALVMSGSFETTIEALACGVGDVVLLQHDMPEWGESGRIQPGSTRTKIKIDRPLSIPTNPSNFSLLIVHPAVKRGQATISNVVASSKTVYLTGIATSIRAKRFKSGDKDLLILGMTASGGYLEVSVEDAAGLVVGASVELWDVDVIEARKIHAYNDETDELTLAGPFSTDPQDFANYMVGESNREAKPVSVTSVAGSGDYKRTISFIEYNETIFDPVNVQETPLYTDPVRRIGHVQDLRVYEELSMRSGSLTSNIIAAWNAPTEGDYAGARVFIARNGGAMEFHGTTSAGAVFYNINANMGEKLEFKVVAYDGAGRTASYNTAPYWEYLVVGASAPPAQVKGFKVEKGMNGIEFSWNKSPELDVTGYEIREGSFWEGATTVVDNYAGNRFFTTKKNSGMYMYHIKAIDMLGNVSEQAATATLLLIAPSIVMGFSSVQNGDHAVLEWRKNPEVDVIGYEIRSGMSWANSQHVVYVSGTSYSIPVGATAIDSYLIKAYDTAGVESLVAARVNQQVTRSQSYNAVHVVDATALGYPGAMMGFSRVSSRLEGEDATETEYAEYVQEMDMQKRYNAMVTTQEIVTAKSDEVRTWKDMRFGWNSSKASAPWFPTADADDISLLKEISLYVGKRDGDIVAWPLKDTSGAKEYGTGTIKIENASDTPNGRFGHGLLVSPSSTLQANFSGANFVSWWMRPTTIVTDICEVLGSTDKVFVQVEGDELVLSVASKTARASTFMTFQDGNNYNVSVFYASSKTKVYIRCLESKKEAFVELSASIGSLSGIRYV